MSREVPFVSVIVPAPPSATSVPAVEAARKLDWPSHRMEILLAKGRQPSRQRNLAWQQARGEWIYFLDDDALPPPDNLARVEDLLEDDKVAVIGGPSLVPDTVPSVERVFARVLNNPLAFGPSRARYARIGTPRTTSEKELILCNLCIRKSAMEMEGGFDEALYPNEENALMDAIQATGKQLRYEPDFIIHRRPRANWSAFARMVFRYGCGRMEQFRGHPGPGSLLNFVPAALLLYVVILPWIPVPGCPVPWAARLLPLIVYVLGVCWSTRPRPMEARELGWKPSTRFGKREWILTALGVALTHFGYGAGLWAGLFTSPRAPEGHEERAEVSLESIPCHE